MERNRTEILKLVILSAWISAAGGAAFSTSKCPDGNTIGCISPGLRDTFGSPAPRSVLNSRFRVKSRLSSRLSAEKKKRHQVDKSLDAPPLLSNQHVVMGDPTVDHYDVGNLSLPHFDPEKKVVVIIHGWQIANEKIEETFRNQTTNTVKMGEWVSRLQETILENDDANVVIYDWRGGAKEGYMESRKNTWTAGQEVFLFLHSLMKTRGLKARMIHLVGHSLGCHVAGIAGKRMFGTTGKKIGRISALDPASPSYRDSPDEVRLSRDDALLVDVYHTDGGSRLIPCGIYDAVGHVDFYPNNGTDQPFCHERQDTDVSSIFESELCDHMMAYDYFTKSLTQDAEAVKCGSYAEFLDGKCARCKRNGCLRVGYFLDEDKNEFKDGEVRSRREGKYFYQTSAEEDYCAKTIMFEIQWSRGLDRDLRKNKRFGKNAHFVLTVHGQNGNHTTKIDHLDKMFATGDSTSRKKRPNLVRVVRLPCSMAPIPLKEVKVTLVQECPKAIKSVRSLWGGLLNGGCDEMAVNIRRVKVRQLAPDTYRDNFRLLEKRDKGKTAILRSKTPRRSP